METQSLCRLTFQPMKHIFLISLIAFSSPVFSQTEGEQAAELYRKAIKLMDLNQFDRSIDLLEQAKALDPEDYSYDYEIGLAYLRMGDFDKAISQYESTLESYNQVDAIVYQMLGNAHDMNREPEKALEVYDRGIEAFPDYGNLYYEKGVVYFSAFEDYNNALESWETGILKDPTYPSNYYFAAILLIDNGYKTWGMLYGETFMNLEFGTERADRMSELLFDTFTSAINIQSKKKASVDLGQTEFNIFMQEGDDLQFPPEMMIQIQLTAALGIMVAEEKKKIKELNSRHLFRIRELFLDQWYSDEENTIAEIDDESLEARELMGDDGSFSVFRWQKMLADADLLEPYTYWLFKSGDPESFTQWRAENEVGFNIFVEWMNSNEFPIDPENVMSRIRS